MKTVSLVNRTIATLILSATVGQAQTIFGWDTNGLLGYGPSPFSATTSNANLTIGGLTRGGGVTITGSAAENIWGGGGFNQLSSTAAITNADYISFTVQANAGYAFSLSSLNATFRRGGAGPTNYLWQYSNDGTSFNDISSTFSYAGTATNGEAQPSVTLSSIGSLQNVTNGTTITMRLVAWNGPTGNWGFGRLAGDDLSAGGSASAIPEPSTYAAMGGAAAFVCAAWFRRRKRPPCL